MNELKVIREYMKFNHRYGHFEKYYELQCYCGNIFDALASNVLRQRTKSCGCRVREKCIERSTKHGTKDILEFIVYG
jgi:hypothetical protein